MSVVALFILPEISKFTLELFSTTKYTVFCLYPTKHSSEPIVNYITYHNYSWKHNSTKINKKLQICPSFTFVCKGASFLKKCVFYSIDQIKTKR
jgi:hypothetical protein